MIPVIQQLFDSLLSTLRDVLPIAAVLLVFQFLVLRKKLHDWKWVVVGFGCVVLGLASFLVGLELAIFPLGEKMARQLSDPHFVDPVAANQPATDNANPAHDNLAISPPWYRYYWTYLFAFAVAFTATIAEPALLAVAIKASQVSGGTIHVWGLRVAVAAGAGIGVMLGTLRIILGVPLPYFIVVGYLIVIVQTYFAPKQIVPLAYDSGGVTTSTVTVPLVAALGLGLAGQLPGRDPLVDGFGMIALAVLFPMITVMGYAQLGHWWTSRDSRG